ncbi:hypothetical protein HOLleu_15683 [Holothuria leucospilota]|uniref:Uncharacterized protein n=1 Tax=Holothuria leucospilota TaxID=206669 RepID=A0A9Q1C5J1_HOLLE|nr:hypothetical protein HOLleu_15683 [Holothuria leucospilota]
MLVTDILPKDLFALNKMGDGSKSKPLRVFLWIVPRANSTVLTKCLSFMDDTVVWMEPYMACHLNETMYNPEFKKGDPAAEKMRENTASLKKMEKMITFMTEMKQKTNEYYNIFDLRLFFHYYPALGILSNGDGKTRSWQF